MEFHQSHHKDNQSGQPGTIVEADQQEGETQREQGQEDSSTEEEESYSLFEIEKEELPSHRRDMLRQM